MKLLLSALLLMPAMAHAERIPNSSLSFAQSCAQAEDCLLRLFYEISKTYRPPREEKALGDYVLKVRSTAEQIWKTPLPFKQDKLGNIVIYLPPTGKFAHQPNLKPFALQSHMDMVLAYYDAKPGEDIRKYFKDGVQLEIVGDWLQSKSKHTSIGIDNGIGVATALRILIDPQIPHPPLELIFTVQEEIGLIGAMMMEMPVLSRRMVCLDGMAPTPKTLIAGAQGGLAKRWSGLLHSEDEPAGSGHVKVTLTGLFGGHSGGDIFRKRLNAIIGFAELYRYLSTKTPEVRLQSIIVGDIGVANKIPNLMTTVLSMPGSTITPALKTDIENFFRALVQRYPDENKDYKLVIEFEKRPRSPLPVLSKETSKAFAHAILESPNGIIDKDPQFPFEIFSSSNLSYWQVGPTSRDSLGSLFGYFTRSFSDKRLVEISKLIDQNMVAPYAGQSQPKEEITSSYPPWLVPQSSPLMKLALSMPDVFEKTFILPGGLEPSVFTRKYKDMDVIALGPYILNAHTINEGVYVSTINPTFKGLLRILAHE